MPQKNITKRKGINITMKKILSLSIALIMVMALVGCNTVPDSGSTGKSEPITDNDNQQKESLQWDLIPMVMIEGELYFDTNTVITEPRKCGVMDGETTSEVSDTETPTENNQSNFGTGFEYQFVGDGKVDIFIGDNCSRFEAKIEEPALADPVAIYIQDFSPTGATIIIENQTEQVISYGKHYSLQALNDGTWEDVDYINDGGGIFEDIGYELLSQTNTETINIDWRNRYGALPDGAYRLVKPISSEQEHLQIHDDFELIDGQKIKVSRYIITELDSHNNIISEKEMTDETAITIIEQAIFDVLVKSARLEVDTSTVETFYKVTTVYSNNETSDMLFYDVDGTSYGDGTVCNSDLYKTMIDLLK